MLEGINWFDAAIIALIVLFGLRGLTNGIIKEIFGILGLIGGLILAVRYKAMAGAWTTLLGNRRTIDRRPVSH